MSNQPDVIEKYLDQVCWHLQMMPEDDVAEIRCELREHLRLSVEDLVANGMTAEAAPSEATRKFGRARRVGLDIAMKSPYAWMWHRAEDDEITMAVGFPAVSYLLLLLPAAVMILAALFSWHFHHRFLVPMWFVLLSGIPFFIYGLFEATTLMIRKASEKNFNQLSREIAVAVRTFDANSLPRWKRALNLHRVLPAMRLALPFVDNRAILRRSLLLFVFGSIQSAGMIWLLTSVHGAPRHGDYGVLLVPAMFGGEFIGEAAFLSYIWFRRRLIGSKKEAGDVEPA